MKKIKLKKVNKSASLIFLALIFVTMITLLHFTKSESLDSLVTEFDKPLELGSELTYYLDVTYDGVDREGVEASSTTLSKIYSDYIYVEDKLPDGLTFKEFEVSNFMTGARPQGDIEKSCDGYVYDDSGGSTDPKNYKGLHYNEETRTVSFRIKRLQAGCHLTIGIVTTVPTKVDDPTTPVVEKRRDFWNSASAWEGSQFVTSNLVHAWIESEEATLYEVSYRYDDTAPSNVPIYQIQEYAAGTIVNFMPEPKIEGYIFKGWTIVEGLGATNNNNGTFVMPNSNVIVQGSFEKIPKNLVIYEIDGDIPEGYVTPDAKEYYRNTTISVDSMKKGDTFNGYKFLGWTSEDVEIDENDYFVMPEKDVTIKGKFEVIKYKVEYQYQGTNIPPNAIPPSSEEFAPGVQVTLPHVSNTDGYEFLYWDKEDGFIMPAENVVVYGEWRVKTGIFTPEIKKVINNPKDYYYPGDIVNYTITVTNTADFPIKNVIIRDNNEKTILYFSTGCSTDMNDDGIGSKECNIESRSEHIVQINYIGANSSVTINASYLVTDEDLGIITNEAEILGALADNNYVLDQEKEYKSEVSFKVASQIKICKIVTNDSKTGDVFRFHIENETYDGWLKLSNGECKSIYLAEDTYKVSEVIPQEYNLESVTLARDGSTSNVENRVEITTDSSSIATLTFENKYKKKPYYHSSGTVENRVLASAKSDYVVNYYFDEELVSTEKGSGALGESIPYNADKNSTYQGRHYALDKIVGENKVISSNSEDNIIDVYYALDVLVDPSLPKQEEGDSVPDKYQVTVTFVVVNGTWNGTNSANINNVLTKYKNGVPSEDGSNILGGIIPVGMVPNTGYTAIGSGWDAAISAETFVTGNVTYTFTFPVAVAPIVPTPNQYIVSYNVSGQVPTDYSVPADVIVVRGSNYTIASSPATQTGYYNGIYGTFTFSGWSHTGTIIVNGNLNITGTWSFTASPNITDPIVPTVPDSPL